MAGSSWIDCGVGVVDLDAMVSSGGRKKRSPVDLKFISDPARRSNCLSKRSYGIIKKVSDLQLGCRCLDLGAGGGWASGDVLCVHVCLGGGVR